MTLSTSATSSGSSALVTSSRRRRSGSIARARTIATRCCWPPESRSGKSRAFSSRPNRRSSDRPRSSASAGFSFSAFRGPRVTLSRTLMWGKRLKDWKTIPIRRRIRLTSTLRAVISSPSTTIRPASIGSMRLMQRRSVDLPLPEAPIRQITSCSATVRSMPRSTSFFPNDLWRPSMTSAGPPEAGVLVAAAPVTGMSSALIARSLRRGGGRAPPARRPDGPAGSSSR